MPIVIHIAILWYGFDSHWPLCTVSPSTIHHCSVVPGGMVCKYVATDGESWINYFKIVFQLQNTNYLF